MLASLLLRRGLPLVCIIGVFSILQAFLGSETSIRDVLSGGSSTCDSSFDESWYAIPIYSFGVFYMFLGLAIICDDYFVGSLEAISEALSLSEDVAGATFMAAGSSAPELFTSIMAVFGTENDVGVGTIVGSAVFNILLIIGVSAAVAGPIMVLDWRPLVRDSLYYLFSILLLARFFGDDVVEFWEACCLLGAYVGYILLMVINGKIFKLCEPKKEEEEVVEPTPEPNDAMRRRVTFKAAVTAVILARVRFPKLLERAGSEPIQEPEPVPEEEESSSTFMTILSWPLSFLMTITCPDCTKDKWKKWYLATFASSIAWIGILSYFMVNWVTKLGCIFNVHVTVMGLTVVAAGTSVPDMLSSVLVAKSGAADMAVSNAIGSNVFDILLGLGGPWVLKYIIFGTDTPVQTGGITTVILMLMMTLVFVFLSIMATGFRMIPIHGYFYFILYVLFVAYNVMVEFNVI